MKDSLRSLILCRPFFWLSISLNKDELKLSKPLPFLPYLFYLLSELRDIFYDSRSSVASEVFLKGSIEKKNPSALLVALFFSDLLTLAGEKDTLLSKEKTSLLRISEGRLRGICA